MNVYFYKFKRMIVTEVYDDMKTVMKYCNYNGQPAAYFPFNFQFIQLRNGTNPQTKVTGVPFDPKSLKCLIDPWFDNLVKGCWSNWQLGNHDNTRIGTRIGTQIPIFF
jgi:alpha-glucosidase